MKRNNILSIIILVLIATISYGQERNENQVMSFQAKYLGKSIALRDIAPRKMERPQKWTDAKKNHPKRYIPNFTGKGKTTKVNQEALPYKSADPTWQKSQTRSGQNCIAPEVNIEGISSSTGSGTPPDPTGAIGKNHYVQMVNATFMNIYDKDGNQVMPTFDVSQLWQQFNVINGGDPIVIYDELADKWFVTEFSQPGQDFLLIAVSTTSDPTGSWTAYSFNTPNFPDYPKYAIWENAIMVTTNESGSDLPIYCLDRTALINGDPDVEIMRFTIPRIGTGPGFQVVTPINLSGTTIANNANPMIIRMVDDAWGTVSQDVLEIWEFNIVWGAPEDSGIIGGQTIITSPFDSDPCSAETGGFACIPQPDPTQGIDGIKETIMNQCHYRNFGGHESIVLNFIADVDGNNLSGIRWFELRRTPGNDFSVYQEGNFAPDEHHRFMGGIAIDIFGNIGLGYSISSSTRFPSLAYTARRAGDPLGQMTIEEYVTAEGGGSSNFHRYGDYSQMTVDPFDGKTFWYTGEYMRGDGDWGTKIFSFSLGKDSLDLGVESFIEPVSSSFLSDMEPVSVNIKNYGIKTVSNFEVSLFLDGVLVDNEVVNEFLDEDQVYMHTFQQLVDLSEIRDYELTAVVDRSGDTNENNDTLRTNISKYLSFDAGIASIMNENKICASTLPITYELKNFSDNPLTAINITVKLNGAVVESIPWTGNLEINESEFITTVLTSINSGINEIEISVDMPNGNVDQNSSNDMAVANFEAILNGEDFTLSLQLDDYPVETSWILQNEQGDTLYVGGQYTERDLITEVFCLDPTQCYTFTIFDSYGDGMIGTFGNNQGDYEITNDQGDVLASLSQVNFGESETSTFCREVECMLTAEIDILHLSSSTETDGAISITPLNGIAPFSFSIDGGVVTSTDGMFIDLAGGVYNVWVMDANDCIYEQTVEISTCDLQASFSITNATMEQSLDGEIIVNATGGVTPLEYSNDDGFSFQSANNFQGLPAAIYKMVVRDAIGCLYKLEIEVEVGGIVVDPEGTILKIGPNPTEGLFKLEFQTPDYDEPFLEYEILDVRGRLIRNGEIARFNNTYIGQISIYTDPSGVYILRFVTDDIDDMVRIIKI